MSAIFSYQAAELRHAHFRADIATMIERFISSRPAPAPVLRRAGSAERFVTEADDDETLAKEIFGSFSYSARYRDSNSRGNYFPRPIDGILDDRLRRGDWVIVEGHPLAGKTRSVFEAIKRLRGTSRRVTVWPFKEPRGIGQKLALPTFPDTHYRIVWMDDMDVQCQSLIQLGYPPIEISQFLQRVADDGAVLVATTRTGPAHYDLRYRLGLDDRLWEKLQSFPINRLAGAEERRFTNWYEAQFGENLPSTFDHHPGSVAGGGR